MIRARSFAGAGRSLLRQLTTAVAVIIILPLLAACSENPASVRLGYHEFPAYELLVMAAEDGLYGETEVRPVEYASATQNQRAFRNGAIDVAAVTLDEALTIAQDVPDLRVLFVLDRSHGGDAILARPEIKSLAELRGRRVGAELTALGAYMLSRALEQAGMTPNDVEVVHAQFDSHERLYREGKVDAVITFEPVRSRLLGAGARVLFDSTAIPHEIFDVLVTRAGFADARPQAMAELTRGWLKVVDYLQTDPEAAIRRVADRLALTPAEVSAAFKLLPIADVEDNRRYLTSTDATMPAQIQRLTHTMARAGLLTHPAPPASLLDTSVAHRALRPDAL